MTDRRPLVSGNWKMNLNHLEGTMLLQRLTYELGSDVVKAVDVSVHPPFTDLRSAQTVIDADRMPFILGAQNCHHEEAGAFTGEVSPTMLAKLGVSLVIVGHSERRELFGENDELINRKAKAVFRAKMVPILCVGETLDQRESGEAEATVARQLTAGLDGLSDEQMSTIIVAYEPVWAIGTGRTALPEDAQAMCASIRSVIRGLDPDAAGQVRIQYGGSVKPGNARELLSQPDIDGALVGGASLDADDFSTIVAAAAP